MKKQKQPRIITLVILTTITVLTWASFEVWRAFINPQPAIVNSKILRPIDPNIDTKTLDNLTRKIYFPDSAATGSTSPTSSVSPSPTASSSVKATSSATPKASPTATSAPTSSPGGTQ